MPAAFDWLSTGFHAAADEYPELGFAAVDDWRQVALVHAWREARDWPTGEDSEPVFIVRLPIGRGLWTGGFFTTGAPPGHDRRAAALSKFQQLADQARLALSIPEWEPPLQHITGSRLGRDPIATWLGAVFTTSDNPLVVQGRCPRSVADPLWTSNVFRASALAVDLLVAKLRPDTFNEFGSPTGGAGAKLKPPAAGDNARKPDDPPRTSAAPKRSVNARMLEKIQTDLATCSGWTAQQWADYLGCVKSSVVATAAWKDLAMGRERQRAEKAKAKRRRPKASDARRE